MRSQIGSALWIGLILCGWAIAVLRERRDCVCIAQIGSPCALRHWGGLKPQPADEPQDRRRELVVAVAGHHVTCAGDIHKGCVGHQLEEFLRVFLVDELGGPRPAPAASAW